MYFASDYNEPDRLTTPVLDPLCLKCHGDLRDKAKEQSFHRFMSHHLLDTGLARVDCIQCHSMHTPWQEHMNSFLIKTKVVAACDICHRVSPNRPGVLKTLGLD